MKGESRGCLSRCFHNESHHKNCNSYCANEVGNVRVEAFHAVPFSHKSLQLFL